MPVVQTVRRGAASVLLYTGMMFFGGLLIFGPLLGPMFFQSLVLSGAAKAILVSFGVVTIAIGIMLTVITKLYVKSESDLAWVKTGMGGRKAILDGGTVVVPFAHSMTPVSLMTMKLKVERKGLEALLTQDMLRADVIAEFFIRIQKNEAAVFAAATSLGNRCTDPEAVMELMFEKLVSALRSVAATSTLSDLNSKREAFAQKVQEIVQKELEPNGLTLETVTISHLDQTPPTAMNGTENVFDAQGMKTIAETTQKFLLERRQIELDTEQKLKEREVSTAKFIAEQDVTAAKVQAEAEAQKAKAAAESGLTAKNAEAEANAKAEAFKAEQDKTAGEVKAQTDQAVRLAKVEADRKVLLAEVDREQQLAVAKQTQERATGEAEVEKTKVIEVAKRNQQISVSQKETERARAEADRLAAEKDREAAAQEVKTVEAVKLAEREKQTTVIAEQAKAEREKIGKNMEADITAYAKVKVATAEAEAADKEAEATRKRAQANKESAVLEAEGKKANDLIPVQVNAEQVTVDQRKVEVLKQELEARTANEKAAVDLQISLATIAADKDARIAFAQAMGSGLAAAKMQIFGDPQALNSMLSAFNTGIAHGQYATALTESTPPEVKGMISDLLKGVTAKLAGKTPSKEELATIIAEQLKLQ